MAGSAYVPYVVRAGDHLLKIALRMGFDADAVWKHPKNTALRASRPSMHLLCPGDVLYVPGDPRTWSPVNVGSSNQFTATVPTVQITVTFALEGKALASEACTVRELPALTSLKTTSDGTLDFDVPMALELVTVEFPRVGLVQPLRIGHLDPLAELSGVYQRLSNLGCVFDDSPDGGILDEQALREPLCDFEMSEGVSDPTGDLDDDARAKLKSVYGC